MRNKILFFILIRIHLNASLSQGIKFSNKITKLFQNFIKCKKIVTFNQEYCLDRQIRLLLNILYYECMPLFTLEIYRSIGKILIHHCFYDKIASSSHSPQSSSVTELS